MGVDHLMLDRATGIKLPLLCYDKPRKVLKYILMRIYYAGAVLLVRRTKLKVFPVPLVQEGKRGHRGKMALRGHRDHRKKMALVGHRDRGEKIVFRAPKATKTTKAILGMKDGAKMDADIDMNNHGIRNLQSPLSYSTAAAVNVEFLNQQINASNTKLFEQLMKDYIACVNRSLLTPGHRKDIFRYLMEDAAEATSENIRVLGISDFPNSPHQVNKKAYNIQLVLGEDLQYRSHIGFNLHPMPVGYHTMIVEFLPPEMTNVSVTLKATTVSISNYASTIFTKYTKTLINFHRWNSTPPQFIYLHLHGQSSDPGLKNGKLIVYGVQKIASYLNPNVYDSAFFINGGRMVLQTDPSLHWHRLIRPSYINGYLNLIKSNPRFVLNGVDILSFPGGAVFKNIVAFCMRPTPSPTPPPSTHLLVDLGLSLRYLVQVVPQLSLCNLSVAVCSVSTCSRHSAVASCMAFRLFLLSQHLVSTECSVCTVHLVFL